MKIADVEIGKEYILLWAYARPYNITVRAKVLEKRKGGKVLLRYKNPIFSSVDDQEYSARRLSPV